MAAVTAALCSTLLFVGLFVFVSAEQKVTAESGQNINLLCRATNNARVVKWSRADLGSEYVLLYRDGHFDQYKQHPSFKNRVDLQDTQMKDGDVSLVLKTVTTNDTGTYECHVVQRGANNEPICSISLRVVDPPGPTGGSTEDGGKEDEVKEDGAVGLIVGLSIAAVLLVAVFIFVIYRKRKRSVV